MSIIVTDKSIYAFKHRANI